MDDSRQISKKIEWLDEQRLKDRKVLVELQERLRIANDTNHDLQGRVKDVESELSGARELLNRVKTLDDVLEHYTSPFMTRLDNLEALRAKSDREGERLRHLEREAINRSLTDLRDSVTSLGILREDMDARKDEEYRTRADIKEIRSSVEKVSVSTEENSHLMSSLNEGRRLISKQLAEIGSVTDTLRKRVDDFNARLETVQDASLRNAKRLKELTGLESERQMEQTVWMEKQVMTHAERERWWDDLHDKSIEIDALIEDSARKLDEFGETHRDMKRALSHLDDNIAGIELRIGESAEVQRVNNHRLQDEWNTFVSAQEKTRAADLLLQEEKWHEHDRKDKSHVGRIEAMEEDGKTTAETLNHLRWMDQQRLKQLFSILSEFMAEYDQDMRKIP